MKRTENNYKTVTPEKILAAIYIGLIVVSLASLIWAIVSGQISIETIKYW